jgi:hypothetical protein
LIIQYLNTIPLFSKSIISSFASIIWRYQ